MGNIVTNVCVKSHYDQLRINKALAVTTTTSTTTFAVLGDPFVSKQYIQFTECKKSYQSKHHL